jgi:hypothetical protein
MAVERHDTHAPNAPNAPWHSPPANGTPWALRNYAGIDCLRKFDIPEHRNQIRELIHG